jgi:periplasmic protein TonB
VLAEPLPEPLVPPEPLPEPMPLEDVIPETLALPGPVVLPMATVPVPPAKEAEEPPPLAEPLGRVHQALLLPARLALPEPLAKPV